MRKRGCLMLVACWNFLIGRVLRRVFVQKFVQKNVSGSFFPPETFYDSCRVFKGCEPLWDDDFLLVHDVNAFWERFPVVAGISSVDGKNVHVVFAGLVF